MKFSAEGMKRVKAQWMEERQSGMLLEKHEYMSRSGIYAAKE